MARGISTATFARRAAAIAIAAAAATALSACGAGQVTQTDTKQSAIAGINIDDGDLSLRNLQVESDLTEGYAVGDSAALRVWISNGGEQAVSLVAVTTEYAEAITLVSGDAAEEPAEEETTPEEEETTPEGEEGAEGDEGTEGEGTDESTDEAADGETDEASDEPTEEPVEEAPAFTGEADFEIELGSGDFVRLDRDSESGDYLYIEGLLEPLVTGGAIPVVFEFSDGTEVSVTLPVVKQLEQEEPSYFDHPGLGGH